MPPDAVLAQSYQCFSQPWGAHVEPLAYLLLLTLVKACIGHV